ncbi:transposase DNA-binding-containing protein [Hymenobacter sp. BRD67]|uniref:IS4/Tn5 family transposase DNA-binding protein n=1 Tax=Hymenobacter sp. BRD67 TaxID=2675877 RepID=UPI00156463B6|nr:hypothetical protein GKZ67_14935 [Hymenobacter sp. BRD67]QKG54064.1 hypothetical protein GKZ67_17490 [Hymenobacter sp. BRD67]
MRISQQFCDAQQWASTHFGTVQLGDVRRQRRVCTLVAGWARQPGASIPQLGPGRPTLARPPTSCWAGQPSHPTSCKSHTAN